MNKDDLHPYKMKQDNISENGFLKRIIDHGVAAVFDDDNLTIVFPNIGESIM